MNEQKKVIISVTSVVDTEAQVVRVFEAMSRVVLGLSLDGINTNIHIAQLDEEGEPNG